MIYRFESFELDEERCELRQAGRVCPLPRRSFDVLRLLLERAGHVVTKREIFEALWKGQHVGDSVLPVHVRTIRRALGARASASIVQTIRGRGYLIACRVERADGLGLGVLAATRLRRAPPRRERGSSADALATLSQVTGMLSLALVLNDLELAGESLDWLVASES